MIMKKLPKKILEKKEDVLKKEKEFSNSTDGNYYIWTKKLSEYEKARFFFVNLCVRYRLSYQEIAELIGITKARAYQLHRYGLTGKLTGSERKEILDREENRCLICRTESKYKGFLHVHHISNPRDKSRANLVALCPSCHTAQDAARRKSRKHNYTSVY